MVTVRHYRLGEADVHQQHSKNNFEVLLGLVKAAVVSKSLKFLQLHSSNSRN